MLVGLVCLVVGVTAPGARRIKEDNAELVDANALAKHRYLFLDAWSHPDYPPDLKAAGIGGTYVVRYVVDETAAITSVEGMRGDPRFRDAALAAIRQWRYRYSPGTGETTPECFEVEFTFDPRAALRPADSLACPYRIGHPDTEPAEELLAPDPIYPDYLGHRELFGEVEFRLSIDRAGAVDGVKVLRATYPDFITTALATLERWKFQPAHQGRLTRKGEKGAVLSFIVRDHETNADLKRNWPELNGIVLHVPGDPKIADYFTEPMTPLVFVDPVYPAELREKAATGSAKVSFSVDEDGRVTGVAVVEASQPEFGGALAAAVASWTFNPLYRDGEKTIADFFVTWTFTPAPEGSPTAALLSRLPPGTKPPSAGRLDAIPQPLFRRKPTYPAGLRASHTAGSATVEIIIDRNGQVCLPRVVEASEPEFGWAAATALSQWYFETPRLHGEPVDVRVSVPMKFQPD
jgi:TonB family protein